jgi:integrase
MSKKCRKATKIYLFLYLLSLKGGLTGNLKNRSKKISRPIIKHYERFIRSYFIPFLEENKIKRVNEITIQKLRNFQPFLLEKELNPKTINNNISGAIRRIFDNLVLKGVIKATPFIETEKDIANGKIANKNHYKKYRLLCLLMATCGLRNVEIFMLRKENIIKIRRAYFLDVVNSHIGEQGLKTENSKRKVPIPVITLQVLNK